VTIRKHVHDFDKQRLKEGLRRTEGGGGA